MHTTKKLFAALLALVMILGLAACGKEAEPTTPPPTDGQPVEEAPVASIGAVTLVGLSRVKLHYDTNGNVVVITDITDTACFSEFFGIPCAEAVAKIIQAAQGNFTETFLLVRQEVNTLLPTETFLQDIVAAARKELGNLPVILTSAADQDSFGYFSADTAKTVLAAYLGKPADASYTISDLPKDGYYTATVTSTDASANYTIGALYGSVELQTEAEDDFVEEPYIDFDNLLTVDPSGEEELIIEEPTDESSGESTDHLPD